MPNQALAQSPSKKMNENQSYPQLLSIVMDEMSISQHVEFDERSDMTMSTVGLTLKIMCYPLPRTHKCFMQLGLIRLLRQLQDFFKIDSVNSSQKVNFVTQYLTLLSEVKTDIISFTYDGYPINCSMTYQLGCKFEENDFKTHFSHPVTKKIFNIILDPCHIFKLVRNTLGEKGSIVDEKNKLIDWRYISTLNGLQVGEGLHLGNKLKPC